MTQFSKKSKRHAPKGTDHGFLWARVVSCPSCKGQIPLSPHWRLATGGTGIRLRPDVNNGVCRFEIVESLAEQSPGTVKDAIATCPYPNCGATTPRDYISQEAQAGRLGHQLYCIIYRDQWWPPTKSGKPRKRPRDPARLPPLYASG